MQLQAHTGCSHLPEVFASSLILCNGLGCAANDFLNRQDQQEAWVAHDPIPERREPPASTWPHLVSDLCQVLPCSSSNAAGRVP